MLLKSICYLHGYELWELDFLSNELLILAKSLQAENPYINRPILFTKMCYFIALLRKFSA